MVDDLKHLSAEVGSIGELAKNQAAYLQAMSQKANQLAQMVDSYIHGTAGNEASEICTALFSAGDQIMKACFALLDFYYIIIYNIYRQTKGGRINGSRNLLQKLWQL